MEVCDMRSMTDDEIRALSADEVQEYADEIDNDVQHMHDLEHGYKYLCKVMSTMTGMTNEDRAGVYECLEELKLQVEVSKEVLDEEHGI